MRLALWFPWCTRKSSSTTKKGTNCTNRAQGTSGSGRHHGSVATGAVTLIETVEDAETYNPDDTATLAFVTQTTLSVDDTHEITSTLRKLFPEIKAPHKEDICCATTNRQEAIKHAAPKADAIIVVGAPNSSNSQRLREVGERAGCKVSVLLQLASEIVWEDFAEMDTIAITAGASAPEILVEEIIDAFAARFDIKVETVRTAD